MALSDKWEDLVKRLVQFSVVSTARVIEFEIAGLGCVASLKVSLLAVSNAVGSKKL